MKRTIMIICLTFCVLAVAVIGLIVYYGMISCHENEVPTLTERENTEVMRLAGFIEQYSPDDESFWARDEAEKQLAHVTGKESDFYQDQAYVASAWSYVFYGLSYMPMCYHATSPYKDLKQLSDNIIKLDSTRRYNAGELADLQIKAMKAQVYFHHTQGNEKSYKAKIEMITEAENKNKGLSARFQLMNNQILFYELLVQDIASIGDQIDDDSITVIKEVADSIDNNTITDDKQLVNMSEAGFRKRLSKMISANCKAFLEFNNCIAKISTNKE